MARAGDQLQVPSGVSTVLPDLDFETYSEAGYLWDEEKRTWRAPPGATKKGIFAVGAAAYAQHPSTEILSLAYDLKDGRGPQMWIEGMAAPADLFSHIQTGGLLEAWNCSFEWWIWNEVAVKKLGWPPLPLLSLRDAMAKSRAYAYPGALANAAEISEAPIQKGKEGKRLIQKFSCPRKPTKANPSKRTLLSDDWPDAGNLFQYNLGDIQAEAAVSARVPDLIPQELAFWQATQALNARGVALDMPTVHAAIAVLEQAYVRYNQELFHLTGGAVSAASEVQGLRNWLETLGVPLPSLGKDLVSAALKRTDLPQPARRALELRQLVGSAGVKKVYAMSRQATPEGRAHDLFVYHGAKTGRDTAIELQPQNLVKAGPKLAWCSSCGEPYGAHRSDCPHCGADGAGHKKTKWTWKAVEAVSTALKTRDLDHVEATFGDASLAISGCIRSLFVAGPGKELICSDYSSIEAVVIAMLAGEEWRIEAFHRKEDIYLVSAGKVTGRTLEEYLTAAAETGEHHPDRQDIGKPAELGLGFGGWLNAWRQFDDSDNFSDGKVKRNIIAWREASPMIVELWGGQARGKPWAPERKELFGLEGAAIAAVQNPGQCYRYRMITYGMQGDVLFCQLPSGRKLTYHRPRLSPSSRWPDQLELSFEGWNSNPQMGPLGWGRIHTFGGRLAENATQAVARDIMAYANINLEAADYPVVLRVHDELAAEVPLGFGSIEEYEKIMATLPPWAEGWPVRAAGGWRGQVYRKA